MTVNSNSLYRVSKPVELRVHGVSGSPPARMLYTEPITYDQGPDLAKVYRPHRDDWDVRAFHWGSLTSGRSITAFWILLAPFAMANVAGWMNVRPNSWTRSWLRVASLALTGILFAQGANVAIDIPKSSGMSHQGIVAAFAGLSLTMVVLLGLISTQSSFEKLSIRRRLGYLLVPTVAAMSPADAPTDWSDPATDATVVGHRMWAVHSYLHRLRRLHLGFGACVLALVAVRSVSAAAPELASMSVAGVILVAMAMSSGPTATNRLLLRFTALAPVIGVIVLIWGGVELANGVVPTDVSVADELTYQLALVLGLAALIGFPGWVAVGLLAIATLIGGAFGLTASMLAETYLLGGSTTTSTFEGGAEFVMVGSFVMVVTLAFAFLFAAAFPRQPTDDSFIRRGALRARGLLTVAGVYGLVVGGLAAFLSCRDGCSQDGLAIPSWMGERDSDLAVLFGLPFDPTSVLGWAKVFMVAAPAYLIVRSIVGGLLNGQGSRRQVGILWDLGSFWPRWFHPLAPPAYGPYAVTRLQKAIDEVKPDVLSAHSQGTLVSAVALSLRTGDTRPELFITYGSQLGELYPALFPSVGLDNLVATVDGQLNERWVNLWRPSDPIGGQPIDSLGSRNWEVQSGRGHFRYELTGEFCTVRSRLGNADLEPPPFETMSDCWER